MNKQPTKGFLQNRIALWGGLSVGSVVAGLALFPVTHGISLVAGFAGAGYTSSHLSVFVAGAGGERAVKRRLHRILPKDTVILHDLTLTYNNKTTQIDHIIITDGACLVIETKAHTGHIEVAPSQRYWKQRKVAKSGRTTYHKQLYTPLFQNRLHQRIVNQILEQNGIYVPVYSLVLFASPKARLHYREPVSNVMWLRHLRADHLESLFRGDPSIPASDIAKTLQAA